MKYNKQKTITYFVILKLVEILVVIFGGYGIYKLGKWFDPFMCNISNASLRCGCIDKTCFFFSGVGGFLVGIIGLIVITGIVWVLWLILREFVKLNWKGAKKLASVKTA